MAAEQNVFERMIRADRENQESKHWSGTFIEYLEKIRKDPLAGQARPRADL